MSIDLYSGTPGGGKSFHATCDVLSWVARGKNVIANFPVSIDKYFGKKKHKKLGHFYFVRNTDLTVEFLADFAFEHHKPSYHAQTLVVIDEASILFNARQFDRKDRMDWINFFANHRHLNYNFVLITQQDRMLDRQIRGLIESEFKHRALRNLKLFGLLFSGILGGAFIVVEYYYPTKTKLGANLLRLNKRKAGAYDTMALFDKKWKGGDKPNDNDKTPEKDKIEKVAAPVADTVVVPGVDNLPVS